MNVNSRKQQNLQQSAEQQIAFQLTLALQEREEIFCRTQLIRYLNSQTPHCKLLSIRKL